MGVGWDHRGGTGERGGGGARESLGRHEESAAARGEATSLQPMNSLAWYELGMVYHTLNRRDKLDEVIAHLNRFDPKTTQHLVRATGKSGASPSPDEPPAAAAATGS